MLPWGWDGRTTVFLAFVLLVLCGTSCGRAQVFDLGRDRVQVVELNGFWRSHTGDDPDGKLGWANPDFDDSSWQLGRSDKPLNTQGCPGYSGTAWYRFEVLLPPNHPPLALYAPEIGTSFQVFADGRLIGQYGGLPPHERVYLDTAGVSGVGRVLGQMIPIPANITGGQSPLVIAVRVWQWPDFALFCGGSQEAWSIGDARLMSDLRQQRWNFLFWFLSAQNVMFISYLLDAVAGLGLFLLRRGEREYLWFAAIGLVSASVCAWGIYPVFHPIWLQGYEAVTAALTFLNGFLVPIFFVTLLKQPRNWSFWSTIVSALFGSLMFIPFLAHWVSFPAWIAVIFLAWIPFIVCQFLLVFLPAWRGSVDARLLLIPLVLQSGAVLGGGLLFGIRASGHEGPTVAFLAEKWDTLSLWPFPISVPNVADFVWQISVLAILILRFARSRRDEERLKGEIEAARTVQQVLVPADKPTIPGLEIQVVYKPAGQVGGDFFQVLPACDDSVFIVIGDVSGKGMPAAMAVSLLVGTVRTLVHFVQGPAAVLNAMNQRMLGRSTHGFTTCLVLRIDSDGTAIAANAGHLPPYLGAQELLIDYGLPLGLTAESVYTESSFHLGIGQELTLLTDGVAEARRKTGELFGFERTASITILSAEHIAATAAAFGQQDDITVLKIRRCRLPEPTTVSVALATFDSADALTAGSSASG